MRIIRYQKMHRMEPRDGVKYATVYVKQTRDQRKELMNHIRLCVTEVAALAEENDRWLNYMSEPQPGFKREGKPNRSIMDIMTDMINEARGRNRNGEPKDFALAPIERWNKLFKGTEYEIDLVQTYSPTSTNFQEIFNVKTQL